MAPLIFVVCSLVFFRTHDSESYSTWLHYSTIESTVMIIFLIFHIYTDTGTPYDLVVRQIGRKSIEISWTAQAVPGHGYFIYITSPNGNDLKRTFSLSYIYNTTSVGRTITIHIRAIYSSSFGELLGPETITLLGKDIAS